jgi:hypothetical protein
MPTPKSYLNHATLKVNLGLFKILCIYLILSDNAHPGALTLFLKSSDRFFPESRGPAAHGNVIVKELFATLDILKRNRTGVVVHLSLFRRVVNDFTTVVIVKNFLRHDVLVGSGLGHGQVVTNIVCRPTCMVDKTMDLSKDDIMEKAGREAIVSVWRNVLLRVYARAETTSNDAPSSQRIRRFLPDMSQKVNK